MSKTLLAATALTLLIAAPAFAADRDFDLTNATGYPIKTVLIDEAASDVWTDNMLESTMGEGDTVHMHFGRGDKGCKWDMKVTFTDDTTAEWHAFDLCSISTITLHYNRKTDVTSAELN
jgi:hypothetical protein